MAKETLDKFHNVNDTKIEAPQTCVLKNWKLIVDLAKRATVVFNMVDVSDYFDVGIQSLCLKLNLPLIQGGR